MWCVTGFPSHMGWLRWVGFPQKIGLFCKRALWKRLYSAEETYVLKKPTNYRHPIAVDQDRYIRCWHVTDLFGRFIGLFWHDIGLFCSFDTARYVDQDRYTRCWHVTGLFCRVIGHFWHAIGLFCSLDRALYVDADRAQYVDQNRYTRCRSVRCQLDSYRAHFANFVSFFLQIS